MEKINNNVKSASNSSKISVAGGQNTFATTESTNLSSSKPTDNRNHRVEIDGHQLISIWGVKGVPTFGDKEVKIQLDGEMLLLSGQNLEIKLLDLEKGQLIVKGYVTGLKYTSSGAEKGVLKKIFK